MPRPVASNDPPAEPGDFPLRLTHLRKRQLHRAPALGYKPTEKAGAAPGGGQTASDSTERTLMSPPARATALRMQHANTTAWRRASHEPGLPQSCLAWPGMVISNAIADTLGAGRLGRAGTLGTHLPLRPDDERSADPEPRANNPNP